MYLDRYDSLAIFRKLTKTQENLENIIAYAEQIIENAKKEVATLRKFSDCCSGDFAPSDEELEKMYDYADYLEDALRPISEMARYPEYSIDQETEYAHDELIQLRDIIESIWERDDDDELIDAQADAARA